MPIRGSTGLNARMTRNMTLTDPKLLAIEKKLRRVIAHLQLCSGGCRLAGDQVGGVWCAGNGLAGPRAREGQLSVPARLVVGALRSMGVVGC